MRTILSILFGLSLLLTPAVALAQGGGPTGTGPGNTGGPTGPTPGGGGSVSCPDGSSGLCNPLQAGSLEEFLTAILEFIVRLGTIVVIVMLVVVGFMFVNARGNPEEIKKARDALLWTLVGGVILIGAFVIAEAIKATVEAITS
tara:strand:- start:16530 stop:16961 length:432 start_codon:yes stop_codon:yes gene_type:complete